MILLIIKFANYSLIHGYTLVLLRFIAAEIMEGIIDIILFVN